MSSEEVPELVSGARRQGVPPRVVIVHDYLTQRRGAERVVLSMLKAFPEARLLTSVHNPESTYADFDNFVVETSWLDHVTAFRRDPRLALPLLPRVFGRWDVEADVVLASSSGFAHGIRTSAPKVVYCFNPPRWLYQFRDYVAPQPLAVRAAFQVLRPTLLRWDQRAASEAKVYLTSSSAVQQRIASAYNRGATILAPPVSLDPAFPKRPVPGLEPGFFLVVGGARKYKNVDYVCRAFQQMPQHRLVVVGALPEDDCWRSNIVGVDGISDQELAWLYAHCAAVVAASHEDFGLTPLEGNTFGRPALVLRAGGFLDTLDEGVSGLFIETLDEEAIRNAVQQSLKQRFDPVRIQAHATRYSEQSFITQLRKHVLDALEPITPSL